MKAELVDAIAMSVMHPDFLVPNEVAIAAISNGDFVKVCAGGERFWCVVDGVSLDQTIFYCIVNNDLMDTAGHGYKLGDRITVHDYNIYQIERA